MNPLSISELTHLLHHIIESDPLLHPLTISGDIIHYRHYVQKKVHYLTLSDGTSTIQAILFDTRSQRHPTLAVGQHVIATGRPTIYTRKGTLQFQIVTIKPLNKGTLSTQLERLKATLKKEGLFDKERKKDLPLYPHHITLITAHPSAGLTDVLSLKQALIPHLDIAIIPVVVQGRLAVSQICSALTAITKHPTDIVILLRGGGSADDLACFNDESIVRAIADCPHPVMTAIGHDIDYTLADFVSDYRAATPSSAIHTLATPFHDAKQTLQHHLTHLPQTLYHTMNQTKQTLLTQLQQATQHIHTQNQGLQEKLTHLLQLADSNNPLKKLTQGYSITSMGHQSIRSILDVSLGNTLETRINDGSIISTITAIHEKNINRH